MPGANGNANDSHSAPGQRRNFGMVLAIAIYVPTTVFETVPFGSVVAVPYRSVR